MDIITSREQYIKERANPIDQLTLAHTEGTKQDDNELRQDMQDNTIEGKGNYSKYVKDVNFAVENKLPATERLKLVHEFDSRESELLKLHKQKKLTPISE